LTFFAKKTYKKCKNRSKNKYSFKWYGSLANIASFPKQSVFLLYATIWLNYDGKTEKKIRIFEKIWILYFWQEKAKKNLNFDKNLNFVFLTKKKSHFFALKVHFFGCYKKTYFFALKIRFLAAIKKLNAERNAHLVELVVLFQIHWHSNLEMFNFWHFSQKKLTKNAKIGQKINIPLSDMDR